MRYGVEMSRSVFWLTLLISLFATAFGAWGIWDAQSFFIFTEVESGSAFLALMIGMMGLYNSWVEHPFRHRNVEY